MSPRRRTKPENKKLPERWDWRGKRLYYQIPPSMAGHAAFGGRKRWMPLGSSLSEAHRTWAEIMSGFDVATQSTLEGLISRFQKEVVPTLAPKTQRGYLHSLGRLRAAFQEFHPSQIKVMHAKQYADTVKGGKHDVRVLSALLTFAAGIGVIEGNPLIGNLKMKKSKRDRYVTDEELQRFMAVLPEKWKLYVLLKLEIGVRKGDMLTLTWPQITEDGIVTRHQKTGARVTYDWTPELQEIIDQIRALPRKIGSVYLFANGSGQPYYKDGESYGFNSMWQRWKAKAGVDFTEHDIRAKAASDSTREAAQAALGHADPRMTDAYRRAPKRAKPLGISSRAKSEKQ